MEALNEQCAPGLGMPPLEATWNPRSELTLQRRWVVTGGAGFIGSHLVQALLLAGQFVVGVDDFSTGHRANLQAVRDAVGESAWTRHMLLEFDIVDPLACARACEGADIVLHQAALGSVPRSLKDPLRTHAVNGTGFLNMLVAAREAGCKRFVFAASSSTYGDHPGLPKVEERIGNPLSPYAVTKYLDELYAAVFTRSYGMQTVGLRYFNVFGPRQDPHGAYAAVIPSWTHRILQGEPCLIHGDGETTRDFCFVANVVQANLRAALAPAQGPRHEVFNIAVGQQTTLAQLHELLVKNLRELRPDLHPVPAVHGAFRAGDVRHSLADIGKARRLLGYAPTHDLRAGLRESMPWYLSQGNDHSLR